MRGSYEVPHLHILEEHITAQSSELPCFPREMLLGRADFPTTPCRELSNAMVEALKVNVPIADVIVMAMKGRLTLLC